MNKKKDIKIEKTKMWKDSKCWGFIVADVVLFLIINGHDKKNYCQLWNCKW